MNKTFCSLIVFSIILLIKDGAGLIFKRGGPYIFSSNCRKGWVLAPTYKHSFKIFPLDTAVTFDEAKALCKSCKYGSYLAWPQSVAEMHWFHGFIQNVVYPGGAMTNPDTRIWISGSYKEAEYDFMWRTRFATGHVKSNMWADNEPTTQSGCMHYKGAEGQGYWAASDCNSKYGVVCMRHPNDKKKY